MPLFLIFSFSSSVRSALCSCLQPHTLCFACGCCCIYAVFPGHPVYSRECMFIYSLWSNITTLLPAIPPRSHLRHAVVASMQERKRTPVSEKAGFTRARVCVVVRANNKYTQAMIVVRCALLYSRSVRSNRSMTNETWHITVDIIVGTRSLQANQIPAREIRCKLFL